jgi:CBS domain containing-hemolysin-like protein
VFCEYLPKAWFHSRPLERSRRFAGLLHVSWMLLRPVSAVILWLTRWIVPSSRHAFSRPAPFVTREDLKDLAREGERDGVLSPKERFMIHRVFELSAKRAYQIMVPRAEMVAVQSGTPIAEFYEHARETRFTRMPVFDPERGVFAGVINVFYLLASQPVDSTRPVGPFCRPPLFIPHDMPVDEILPRMRRARQPMCLVVDENREVIGLVTTEDILEEIVGSL